MRPRLRVGKNLSAASLQTSASKAAAAIYPHLRKNPTATRGFSNYQGETRDRKPEETYQAPRNPGVWEREV